MKYYSHVLDLPPVAPYDRQETRFTSWIGNFVRPLREKKLHEQYWFTYYGDHVKYRVRTDQYERLRPDLDKLILNCGLKLRDSETDLTMEGDIGHDRFLSPQRKDRNSEERALLVLQYLYLIAELVVDNLVDEGHGYWALEPSIHEENPNGSNFETLHHLFCNMTQVPVSILISQTSPPALLGTFWGGPRGEKETELKDGQKVNEVFLQY